MLKTTRFDAADYLDSEDRQVAYISAALETGDADFVRDALGLVARARGMSEIARIAGLNRESLYKALGEAGNPEFLNVTKSVPQFAATFFGLTGMHMLHVTLGVVYLGVIALRKWFIPVLLGLWLVAWLGTPAYSPFHYGAHVLLVAAVVISVVLWLKPKVYDSSDVEVAGLYWHFVDLVWMFIFPLVYLMSTRIV